MTQDSRDQQLVEEALAADRPAKLDAKAREEPTVEELEVLSADMIGIDDSVRMYLREIGRVALLTAEEEVVLAKAIELGAQLVDAPGKGIISLHEWTTHDTEHKTRTAKPQHRLPLGPDAGRMVRAAIADEAAGDLLVASPDVHFVEAAKDAQSDGTQEPLDEARHLVLAYNRALTPDAFLTLLDFAYLAVHTGDLDSRDNIGLRALYDWTREVDPLLELPGRGTLVVGETTSDSTLAHGGSAKVLVPEARGRAAGECDHLPSVSSRTTRNAEASTDRLAAGHACRHVVATTPAVKNWTSAASGGLPPRLARGSRTAALLGHGCHGGRSGPSTGVRASPRRRAPADQVQDCVGQPSICPARSAGRR